MNSITANFDQILGFARNYGLPAHKKRAVLREYLQVKILSLLYQEKISQNIFFVGGTSLRLLHGLDRFSQDLDFDAPGIPAAHVSKLTATVAKKLRAENIMLDFYHNRTPKKNYYEFRFPDLLQDVSISQNKEEKLMIKLDFEYDWQGQTRKILTLNRYGFLANVVTKTIDQILIEKLVAYTHRPETQARDVYDIVWLIANGARPDWQFAARNTFSPALLEVALKKWNAEKRKTPGLERKLAPYVFDEKNMNKLTFFPNLVGNFGK